MPEPPATTHLTDADAEARLRCILAHHFADVGLDAAKAARQWAPDMGRRAEADVVRTTAAMLRLPDIARRYGARALAAADPRLKGLVDAPIEIDGR